MKCYTITLIGGTDGFGKWLAGFLLEHFGSHIILNLTGRNQEKGLKVVEELRATYEKNPALFQTTPCPPPDISPKLGEGGEIQQERGPNIFFLTDAVEAVRQSDITVFCVPISVMEASIQELGPHLKQGSIVLDVCSIKGFVTEAFVKYVPSGVTVIPTHPMFGPFVKSIAGQIVVLTPEKGIQETQEYQFGVSFLRKLGARVFETTPKEHDAMMAVVQGLTHYNMFVFAETIRTLGVHIETSLNFVSPVYKLMISSVARYMNQNPKLYGDIQIYNGENLKVHKAFMEASQNFNALIEQHNETGFIEAIQTSKDYFGNQAQKGQVYTDKIIFLLGKQIELLKKNMGKQLYFENIYTGELLHEQLTNYSQEHIFLASGRELLLDEWRVFE